MAQSDRLPRTIVFCECAYADIVPETTRQGLPAFLASVGVRYECVPDLCQLAADRDPRLRTWCAGEASLVILACHPRAVRALFQAAGAPLQRSDVQFLNLRTQGVAEMAALLDLPVPAGVADAAGTATPWVTPAWIPWFPVIDRQRCVDCRQCVSFCLFGVYAEDVAGRVQVVQPRNCKDHCPACARICPEVAIIFPKHPEEVISGEEIADEAGERAKARAQATQLHGTDPYAALQRRRRSAQIRLLAEDGDHP